MAVLEPRIKAMKHFKDYGSVISVWHTETPPTGVHQEFDACGTVTGH